MDSNSKLLRMKNILYLLIFISFGLNAQTQEQLNGILAIGGVSSGGSSDFIISAIFNDPSGVYTAQDIQAGDEIWDGKCDIYKVTAVIQTTPFVQVEAQDINGGTNPSTGNSILYRPTTTYDYPLTTNGLPEKLIACIENHFRIEVDQGLSNNISISGSYKNHDEAQTGGVPVNGYYRASEGNTMGVPEGTVLQLKSL